MQTVGVGPARGLPLTKFSRRHRSGCSQIRLACSARRGFVSAQTTTKAAAVADAATASTATAPVNESSFNSALLQSSRAAVVKSLTGPVAKITSHYHVDFGEFLKVIGSSSELGAWDAAAAPTMTWGEGDVWSLVIPLSAGNHEFKVVVQKSDGELLWETGENRTVVIPENAPTGSMLVADCAFNYSDIMGQPELQPLTEDVLAALERRAEAEMAVQLEIAAAETNSTAASEAAAAVAKALATMDAEAEETGRRLSSSSGSESSVASTEASDEDDLLAAATGTSSGMNKALLAAEEELTVEQDEAAVTAEQEMEQQLEALSSQALDASLLAVDTTAADMSPSSGQKLFDAVHAKLTQDKPVATGFMDVPHAPTPPAATEDSTPASVSAEPKTTSSVVSAFMQSVAKKAESVAAAAQQEATETAAAVLGSPAETEAVMIEPAVEEATAASSDSVDHITADDTAAAVDLEETAEISEASLGLLDVPEESVDNLVKQESTDWYTAESSVATEAVKPTAEAELAGTTVTAVSSPAVPATPTPSPASSSGSATPTDTQGRLWAPAVLNNSASNGGSAMEAQRHGSALSSRGRSTSAPVSPSGSRRNSPAGSRSASPGRGASHVASAAASAVAPTDWMADMNSNGVLAAAREAEEAAQQKAARHAAAQRAAYAAAAESERLKQSLGSFLTESRGGSGISAVAAAVGAMSMPAPPEVVSAMEAQQVFGIMSAASASAAAAAAGLSPPAVSAPSGSSSASRSAAATLTADVSMGSAAVEPAVTAEGWASGMQFLTAVVGCAAVGTVMWSEFILKDTGCGLPPGPYGLLGAAEGLSYLAVLGFAGAGVAARSSSGGKQGLPGALVVPEVMAYGALAAGLLVLASQLQQYGYIPPPLPGGQCYPDAAVALPSADDLSAQLSAQLAALQSILSQLKSAATSGVDQLALQQQLASLQQQIDAFSAYVAAQTSSLDASLQVGIAQLQDSLASATAAVSSFVDTQLQQLDIPGKLEYVLDVLRKQEQVLVTELPKQFAELQRLAATSLGIVQETALQAANASHLPELLASLDKSMGVLHDVLENKIQQLDVVLTQLHDSCAAAASQLAAAAVAAEQSGSAEAAAQLANLQTLLSTAITSVQDQVWAGYQQLALADHLSDALLHIRASAAEVAASATAEIDKLQLEKQLTELEAVAEASLSALSANAMDQLAKLELEQKFVDIENQAAAAAASLQAGLVQQYNEQLPVLQEQLVQLQANLATLAADAQQGFAQSADNAGPQLEALLMQLQKSMEATVRVVGEVAASNADLASQKLQIASSNLGQISGTVPSSAAVSQQVQAVVVEAMPAASSVVEPTATTVAVQDVIAAADAAAESIAEFTTPLQ